MSQTNNLFHICHLMFSSGITRPEVARTIEDMKQIVPPIEGIDLESIIKTLVEQGYVGIFENRYFLLGKGIVAVAAIFT